MRHRHPVLCRLIGGMPWPCYGAGNEPPPALGKRAHEQTLDERASALIKVLDDMHEEPQLALGKRVYEKTL